MSSFLTSDTPFMLGFDSLDRMLNDLSKKKDAWNESDEEEGDYDENPYKEIDFDKKIIINELITYINDSNVLFYF